MSLVLRALSRAIISQLHPRMLLLLLLPLMLTIAGWVLAATLLWEPLNQWLRDNLFGPQPLPLLVPWIDAVGLRQAGALLTVVIALLLLAPLLLLISMLLVSVLATPWVLAHLQRRRYPALAIRGGWTFLQGLGVALSALLLFALGYLLTVPLWLIPIAGLLVPWFWWGWLTARVLRFDTLATHADAEERALLIRRHSGHYLLLGLLLSALNAVPPLFLITPVLSILAFGHFSLGALEALRAARDLEPGAGYTGPMLREPAPTLREPAATALPAPPSSPPA